MSLSTKILVALGAILLFCMGGFIIWKQYEISNNQAEIIKSQVEMKQLADNIVRAQAQYATKADLEAFAKESRIDLEAIKADLATLNATVTGISKTVVGSKGQTGSGVGSTGTTTTPGGGVSGDPYGYGKNIQHLHLDEQFDNTKVPLADVDFDASKATPWGYNIPERKYNITSVLGTDDDGRHYTYNKFSINTGGKDYDVKIASSKFIEEYPKAKLSWWNPKVFLGIDGALNISHIPIKPDATPNVSLSIASYGKTKVQPEISLINIGVGYGVVSEKPQLTVSPVMLNFGKLNKISVLNNTYVGPSLQFTTKGDVSVGASLKVGL